MLSKKENFFNFSTITFRYLKCLQIQEFARDITCNINVATTPIITRLLLIPFILDILMNSLEEYGVLHSNKSSWFTLHSYSFGSTSLEHLSCCLSAENEYPQRCSIFISNSKENTILSASHLIFFNHRVGRFYPKPSSLLIKFKHFPAAENFITNNSQ